MDEIAQLRDDIIADRILGGVATAQAGAKLVLLTLQRNAAVDNEGARNIVVEIADWLTATNPSLAVVHNIADRAREAAMNDGTRSVVEAVIASMNSYLTESAVERKQLASFAPNIIRSGARVLVHSCSVSTLALLVAAAEHVGSFSISITESRPHLESRSLAEQLSSYGIPITLYSDAAIAIAAEECDLAIVGADTIYSDGTFVNKTGTFPIALACSYYGRPMYVASTLTKFCSGDPGKVSMKLRPKEELAGDWDMVSTGRVSVWNQFFERIPASFVSAFVTEAGIVSPKDVAALVSTYS